MTHSNRSIAKTMSRFFVFFTLILASVYSLLILLYSWMVEDNIFNRLLQYEAQKIEVAFKGTGKVNPPSVDFIELHQGWESLPESIVREHKIKPSKIEFELEDSKTVHIRVLTLKDQEYILLADVGQLEVSRDYLPYVGSYLAIILLVIAVVALWVAFRVASKITSPLSSLVREVQRQTDSELSKGFAADFPDNEIGILAQTIETSMNNLQAAIQRESHFTKDVSHELRTPITVLKNLATRVQPSEVMRDEERRQLSDGVLQLEQLTQTLLALARNENRLLQEVDAVVLIENCVLTHHGLNFTDKGKRLQVELELPEAKILRANEPLLKILIDNLLSNAVQYASDSKLRLSLKQDALEFSNTFLHPSPSYPERSGVKSAQSHGIGQGLSLIDRICQQFGWKMSVQSSNQLFVLTVHF